MTTYPEDRAVLAETKLASDKLCSDTSVSQEATLDDLRDLRDHIDMLIESLEPEL